MTIFDVFPFFNELDLLELRLNVMSPFVDFFVLSEATTTFSGKAKPLYFEENKDRFKNFSGRIIHNVVEEEIDVHPFERDRFQKDQIKQVLFSRAVEKDLVIFSDVDEIPNPSTFDQAFSIAMDGQMAHFAQDVFFYYLNFIETRGALLSISGEFPGIWRKKKWLGSRVCSLEYAEPLSMTQLRDPIRKETGKRIGEGGWHFSYCGSDTAKGAEERFREKAMATPHQELVNEEVLRDIGVRVAKGRDPWGRSRPRFRKTDVDDRFPEFLRENITHFDHMILK